MYDEIETSRQVSRQIKDLEERLGRAELSLTALSERVKLLVQEVGVDIISDHFPSMLIEKPTKAYIEVRGKPGHEEVWYSDKDGKMARAKKAKHASAKAGFTIATVPMEGGDKLAIPLVDANTCLEVPFSVVIEKTNTDSLIRVRGSKVEYLKGGKWIRGKPVLPLGRRKIKKAKKVARKD